MQQRLLHRGAPGTPARLGGSAVGGTKTRGMGTDNWDVSSQSTQEGTQQKTQHTNVRFSRILMMPSSPEFANLIPPEGAGAKGMGSSADRPVPDSSSGARGPPTGTAVSRALRRGAAARRCSGRRAESRAPAPSCPPDPSAAPPTPGSPRTLGGI